MCPTIDGSDEELSSIFKIELLATQTNIKHGEDVWVVESLKSLP